MQHVICPISVGFAKPSSDGKVPFDQSCKAPMGLYFSFFRSVYRTFVSRSYVQVISRWRPWWNIYRNKPAPFISWILRWPIERRSFSMNQTCFGQRKCGGVWVVCTPTHNAYQKTDDLVLGWKQSGVAAQVKASQQRGVYPKPHSDLQHTPCCTLFLVSEQ